jgi:hypothetical protein
VTGNNFNASSAGVGNHILTYTYADPATGCINSTTNTIRVNALPVVTFGGTLTAQCVTSTVYTLTGGLPAGGVYSGIGVSGTNFDASIAGPGIRTITYTYSEPATGCVNVATNTITVNALPSVSFTGTLAQQCISSTSYSLSGGSPAGGAYSGPGVSGSNFNASLAGVGTHNIVYTYTNPATGCTNTAINTIRVNALPVVTFGGILVPQCVSSSSYALSGGSPVGGTYSGPGVSGTNFNAGAAGIGTHTIAYTYTDGNGCTNSATNSITVNSLPVPTLSSSDNDNIFCTGTLVTFTAGGGTNYNFRVGGTTVQSGTSNIFATTTLINGQVVDVIVTNSNGCTAVSSGIQNFVNPLPTIFITTPVACSTDLLTYSLTVGVSSGTVTSTAGTVTNTSGDLWSITNVPAGTSIDSNGTRLLMPGNNTSC